MKIAIVGSRGFSNYLLMAKELNNLASVHNISEVVSGGAKGANSMAALWAKE